MICFNCEKTRRYTWHFNKVILWASYKKELVILESMKCMHKYCVRFSQGRMPQSYKMMLQPNWGEICISRVSVLGKVFDHQSGRRNLGLCGTNFWSLSYEFQSVKEHCVMVARRVKVSSGGTRAAQVGLEEPLTCSMRDVCSTFLINYNSLIIVQNAHLARGAGAPT